ncbi:hypothetical protein [Aeromonas veronii]
MNIENMISQHDDDDVIKKSWGGANSILERQPTRQQDEKEDTKDTDE